MRLWIPIAFLTLALAGCREKAEAAAQTLTGGDVVAGKRLAREKGCGSCHIIPGISGAEGKVGPSLEGVALRVFLAGHVENTPGNMVTWVQHPKKVEPGTAMPELGLDEQQARDIAAFLYTLR